MKKHLAGVSMVAVAVLLAAYVPAALAADTCPKSCPANAQVSVVGKIDVKAEKADGKDVKVPYVTVSEAKMADGKACPEMKDKSVKITGAKAADAEKLAGKTVEIKGACKACKEIDAASVTEKK